MMMVMVVIPSMAMCAVAGGSSVPSSLGHLMRSSNDSWWQAGTCFPGGTWDHLTLLSSSCINFFLDATRSLALDSSTRPHITARDKCVGQSVQSVTPRLLFEEKLVAGQSKKNGASHHHPIDT